MGERKPKTKPLTWQETVVRHATEVCDLATDEMLAIATNDASHVLRRNAGVPIHKRYHPTIARAISHATLGNLVGDDPRGPERLAVVLLPASLVTEQMKSSWHAIACALRREESQLVPRDVDTLAFIVDSEMRADAVRSLVDDGATLLCDARRYETIRHPSALTEARRDVISQRDGHPVVSARTLLGDRDDLIARWAVLGATPVTQSAVTTARDIAHKNLIAASKVNEIIRPFATELVRHEVTERIDLLLGTRRKVGAKFEHVWTDPVTGESIDPRRIEMDMTGFEAVGAPYSHVTRILNDANDVLLRALSGTDRTKWSVRCCEPDDVRAAQAMVGPSLAAWLDERLREELSDEAGEASDAEAK